MATTAHHENLKCVFDPTGGDFQGRLFNAYQAHSCARYHGWPNGIIFQSQKTYQIYQYTGGDHFSTLSSCEIAGAFLQSFSGIEAAYGDCHPETLRAYGNLWQHFINCHKCTGYIKQIENLKTYRKQEQASVAALSCQKRGFCNG
jgi:hypothetical protein